MKGKTENMGHIKRGGEVARERGGRERESKSWGRVIFVIRINIIVEALNSTTIARPYRVVRIDSSMKYVKQITFHKKVNKKIWTESSKCYSYFAIHKNGYSNFVSNSIPVNSNPNVHSLSSTRHFHFLNWKFIPPYRSFVLLTPKFHFSSKK